jgi:hypothetical protein
MIMRPKFNASQLQSTDNLRYTAISTDELIEKIAGISTEKLYELPECAITGLRCLANAILNSGHP